MRSSIVLLALAALSSALVVPRATPPPGWLTQILEPYDTYHARYLALDCQGKHKTQFFDECCHPLLAHESLNSRPAQCIPATPAAQKPPQPIASPKATPQPVPPPPAPVTTPAAKVAPAPAPAPAANTNPVNSGGFATFFFQNGNAGACGTVHKDTDLVAAIDEARYGNSGQRSSLCGKQVKITNTKNKKTVTVTIADDCPTCDNSNSIDLSTGAFQQIATLDEGIVPITWSFL